jgi:phosphatidylserine/phosphatidylglycerophosphate/cardiolipin synthase-like enzyme
VTLSRLRGWAALLCAAALAGCASLPPPQPRAPEAAFASPETTPLGRLAAKTAPAPDVSGFRLLISGEDAFGALAALIDGAERSLDLQYYLIRSDGSSRELMRRVVAAAARGVRVRLLLDDLNTTGQDAGLLRFTAVPNVEVRLYNPFPAGRVSTIGRVMASLTDVTRINQRMHNKMLVADNALAITGGRNIGDAYFVNSPSSNFLDVDLLVAGPSVRSLSATFDQFWNSPLAYPVDAVADRPDTEAGTPPSSTTPAKVSPPGALSQEIARGELNLVWADARVLADSPLKDGAMTADLASLLRAARKEVIIISPYFVPGPRGMALARELSARGVRLRVLTNSLASTDAAVVHVGYARYREALLALGVELHELRPHLDTQHNVTRAFGSSQASLHAKVVVVDGVAALVGSMNMDPRSQTLNTEVGVLVRSPQIAQQLVQVFDEVTTSSTYRLSLAEDHSLRWTSTGPDPLVSTGEPGASPWLKLTVKMLAPFAPDELL